MQYQVFLQNDTEQHFVASVVGIPNLLVEVTTEAEAIAKIKTALESRLATGKFITIEVDTAMSSTNTTSQLPQSGIFADDQTFDDWMEKLAAIRQKANVVQDTG